MPYVNVPNDLSKVKTKMALNHTKRQLICFGCAAAVGIRPICWPEDLSEYRGPCSLCWP